MRRRSGHESFEEALVGLVFDLVLFFAAIQASED